MLKLLVAWWGALLARASTARAARLTLGAVGVAVGAGLVLRPFVSLEALVLLVAATGTVIGVQLLTGPTRRPLGALALAAGLGVAVGRDLVLTQLAVVIAIVLVGRGTVATSRAVRGTSLETRSADGLLGAAWIGLGLLAVRWPDVAVLGVAVAFGLRVVQLGLVLLVSPRRLARWRHRLRAERGRRWQRRGRLLGAVVALCLVAGLAGVSVLVQRREPSADAFYDPPTSVPATAGVLLRSQALDAHLPAGVRAWRILYTTTTSGGDRAVASAIVLVSATAPTGPRPVIAWAHGTTGYARRCAPSVLADRYGAGALPAVDDILRRGWVLVATDYTGLGTPGAQPYLVGRGQAYAVLDAVRAARDLDTVDLGRRTVVWGHSQGGAAALWTGQLAGSYAPDVPISGVAALAPAADLDAVAANLDQVSGGMLLASYLLAAYSATYDDVRVGDYVRAAARPVLAADATRCLSEPEVYVSAVSSLISGERALSRSLATGALGARLRANTPRGVVAAPVLIGQGLADDLILPSVQEAYVADRCALGGGALTYREYAGRDHTSLIERGSPLVRDLMRWTTARFAGRAAATTC